METIKEAIEEHILFPPNPDEVFEATEQFLYGLQVTGFIQGVVWSERWIPVEEELPEPYLKVIVKGTIIHSSGLDIPTTTCAWLVYDGNMKPVFTIEGSDNIINNVTHWRPIKHQ